MNINSTNQKTTSVRANFRPILLFIALAYGWTWLWWIPANVLFELPQAWKFPMHLIGVFGPALAGVFTIRWLADDKPDRSLNPWGFIAGVVLAMAAVLLFWFAPYNFADYTGGKGRLTIPEDSPMGAFLLYGVAVLITGIIIAQAVSRRPVVRGVFKSIIPDRWALKLLLPVLLFLPLLLIFSNQLAGLLGLAYETPLYRKDPASVWLPAMFIKLFTVAILTGGNEEYGWRGVLQPLLQRSMSPLNATLIIGVAWGLWHLPLDISGFYGEGHVLAIVALRLFGNVLISVVMTGLYNYSRGSIFLCVIFHACFNTQIYLFGGAQLSVVLAILFVISLIIGMRMWRRERGYVPSVMKSELFGISLMNSDQPK